MKRESILFHGIIPPMITLFDQQGEIDWKANQTLVDWLIGQGIHGILFNGSSGEFPSLTIEERKLFAKEMTAYVNGRIPVIIGTGSTSIKDTIDLSQHAESIGASGVLIVNPYYWQFTDDNLYRYYTTIADHTSISILLYNIPLLTGKSLSSELVTRLAISRDNIVGIKDTIDNIGHIRELILSIHQVRPDFAVFAAFDEHLLPALQIGAVGAINGTANFAPHISVQLYESFKRGAFAEAIQWHQKLIRLMPIYQYSDPFFIGVKEAVHQLVLNYRTGARLPSGEIDQPLIDKINHFLEQNGLK
ncbi:dihydrodipicolinate synthase family protein [Microaerobacter geothermalis]|uniref:dihydrodipicolinate synthase family protein n=1 Tax=Microaerobacter geothermalis TaxID=674972 RepID=UPI001F4267B3|nr:dihydrodipicolinate synthase family protein [Microaerobacter geothermalis]MCF6092935.1 dihydrodipicolinate synthase family protein [Microaerobacter geothermalis]